MVFSYNQLGRKGEQLLKKGIKKRLVEHDIPGLLLG